MLSFSTVGAQTVFGWETATENGDEITETIDGITVTLSGDPDLQLFPDADGYGGTSGIVALTLNDATSVTFTFSEPVKVNSIIPIEAYGGNVDYTFTPTGGSNSPVTASLILGETAPVNLNWVNVTSFTVTATEPSAFGFDNLSVSSGTNGQTFFEWETANNDGGTITETVNGIGVTVSGDSSYGLVDYGGASGTSGNVIVSNADRTAITFTFDQPVVVNSILALDGNGADIDYTFIPIDGDTNNPVTASLVAGVTGVSLNWTNVTSFTVTSSGSKFSFDNLSVTRIGSPILFDFDMNASTLFDGDGRQYVESTINGITVTVTATGYESEANQNLNYIFLEDINDLLGTSGNTARQSSRTIINPIIVTFSEPVVLNSILPFSVDYGDVDIILTPTDGGNEPVVVPFSLVQGEPVPNLLPVSLNWVGVTSFSITLSKATSLYFDNISVNPIIPIPSLGIKDADSMSQVKVYPNPVKDLLYIENVSDLKSVKMYNLLGQQVIESKEAMIDVNQLSKGMYLLQIYTSEGMEIKRIVKY
jgi:hypothetical protein